MGCLYHEIDGALAEPQNPARMRLLFRRLPVLLFLLLTVGCGAQQRLEQQLVDQRGRLQTLTEAYEAQNKRVEALRERVELLEDELETARLAATPRPLPVVRLKPEGAPADEEAGEARDEGGGEGGTVITQADVEALGTGGDRRLPVEPPENAAAAGNIGVSQVPTPAATAQAADRAPDPEPIAAYRAAWNQLKAGDMPAAIAGFSRFAEKWPSHSYTDNALYLVGEARLGRAEAAGALQAFRRVVDEHPGGNKVPDALYMIGVTLDRMGRAAESRETLSRLVSMYPETDAARRAREALRGRAL
jgi:tol-pal system protein YbgF